RYDDKYLSNYATIYCKDELLRVPGVSDINVQGLRDYSMRIWLDPQKLASRNITAMDVATAIRSQNADAPAGRIGQPPVSGGPDFQLPLNTLGRLADPEQFGNIVVKIGGTPPLISMTGVDLPPATPGAAKAPRKSGGGASSPASPMPTTIGSLGSGPATTPPPAPAPTTGSDGNTATASGPTDSAGATSAAGGATGVGGATDSAGGATDTASQTGGSASAMDADTLPMIPTDSLGGGGILGGSPGSVASGIVRLKDVARIELGAQNYNTLCSFDGQPSVGLGLYQLPGTNALEVGDSVRAKMEDLKLSFPDGVDYRIAYDTTTFVRDSVQDVVRTLLESIVLVALVVLVFLQSWRAALIPLLAVPVAILGTFAVMAALGFSLNNISLFGVVLAIGIVVDDAIVVVENVERWMEHGLEAKAATYQAMTEVTGPIIAVGLVLCAVFIPCAFISGITGQFFRQFAVTIAVSTIISTINSLTFSPAMAAILLKRKSASVSRKGWFRSLIFAAIGFFAYGLLPLTLFGRLFNKTFDISTAIYSWMTGRLMRLSLLVLIVYVGLLGLTGWIFSKAPRGFIPQQDQGRLIVNVQLPDAASLERTQEAVLQVEQIARATPGVADTVTNAGMSYLLQSNSSNFASMFIVLDPFSKRQSPELRDTAIMAKLRKRWAKEVDAQVTVYGAAPIPGLGSAGGFKFVLEDRGGLGVRSLEQQMDGLVEKFKKLPYLADARTQFKSRIPQLYVVVDRTKAASMGIDISDVNQTLSMYLGSLYVNSYNDFGRHWQVTIQADGDFRARPDQIQLFEVRSKSGAMVPLSTLVKIREVGGPITVTRYNLYTSATINGNVLPGVSNGEAIAAINQVAEETLPRSMR
ncbi:MAG TPA: efflux RND transporter permease subunit, partial [Urbifossiella sp.]